MAAKTSSTHARGTPHAPAATRTTPAEASEAVSLQPAVKPAAVSEDKIRARAFFMWDQAGRPDGDGTEFWLRAEQELSAPL